MAYAATKELAHELIDRMDPGQLPVAVEVLAKMLDPDDLGFAPIARRDPGSAEGDPARAVQDAPLDSVVDLLAKYGLTPEEFERLGRLPLETFAGTAI
jgi:type II secretory pathway component PulK